MSKPEPKTKTPGTGNNPRDLAKRRSTAAAARLRGVGTRRAEEAAADPLVEPTPDPVTTGIEEHPTTERPLHLVHKDDSTDGERSTTSSTTASAAQASGAGPVEARAGDPIGNDAAVDTFTDEPSTEPTTPRESAPPAPKSTAKNAPKTQTAVEPRSVTAKVAAPALDATVWLLTGPEARLELSGEPIRKMTLEMPVPLVDAIARWELDIMKATGRRVYRERLVDAALAELPTEPEAVIEVGQALPAWLKYAQAEQMGTRIRDSHAIMLSTLRAEMKVRRVKGVYIRHVYSAAILNYLVRNGVTIPEGSLQ